MEESKAVKEASPDTRLLYQRLSKMNVGDFISYADLTEEIGRNVQKEARHYLDSARLICQREHDKTFGVIINEGLKCLTDSEIVETAVSTIGHIRRASRKSIKRLRCIRNFAALSNEDKIRHNANVSAIALIAHMTKSNNMKKLTSKVQETQERLPYAKTLEAFK